MTSHSKHRPGKKYKLTCPGCGETRKEKIARADWYRISQLGFVEWCSECVKAYVDEASDALRQRTRERIAHWPDVFDGGQ
jgi:hypothetical protein